MKNDLNEEKLTSIEKAIMILEALGSEPYCFKPIDLAKSSDSTAPQFIGYCRFYYTGIWLSLTRTQICIKSDRVCIILEPLIYTEIVI